MSVFSNMPNVPCAKLSNTLTANTHVVKIQFLLVFHMNDLCDALCETRR